MAIKSTSVLIPVKWLNYLVILILLAGITFRFINIDKKIYSSDETFTSLRISGYTERELIDKEFKGDIINVKDFQAKYQSLNNEKNIVDTVRGLSQEEAQLPPLYFTLARAWAQFFGTSIWAIRSLSVVLSILAIVCAYWLGLELFESSVAGKISALLMSISPFQVLFSQEARPYSLWTLTILLSGIALLRAMRLKNKFAWLIYSFTVILSLYSFLFSWFVVIGHGVYVIVIERFRLTKTVTAYLRATILGIIFFMPWILAIVLNVHRSYRGVAWLTTVSDISLVQRWIINLGRTFIDFGLNMSNSLVLFYSLLIALLVIYSAYFMCVNTPKKSWLFVLITTTLMMILLGLPDIILGGQRSATCRYTIPFYIGSQMCVTYLFAQQFSSTSVIFWSKKFWQFLLGILCCVGIISCIYITQSDNWWNKDFDELYVPSVIAQSESQKVINVINSAANSNEDVLLISDTDVGGIMSLSHRLSLKVYFSLVIQPNRPYNIPDKFTNIFLYAPSKSLMEWISTRKTYRIEPASKHGDSGFWKLSK